MKETRRLSRADPRTHQHGIIGSFKNIYNSPLGIAMLHLFITQLVATILTFSHPLHHPMLQAFATAIYSSVRTSLLILLTILLFSMAESPEFSAQTIVANGKARHAAYVAIMVQWTGIALSLTDVYG